MKYTDLHPSEQPTTRLREIGSQALTNPELLAVALCYNDSATVEAIGQLFTSYGSLRAIPRDRLMEIKGVGPKVADSIAAIAEIARREVRLSQTEMPVITSPSDAADLVSYEMGCLEVEQLRVILLDTRNRVRKVVTLYQGSVNSSQVRVAEVFREAVRDNVPNIIIVHNHPSGDPTPSPEDVALTQAIVSAGKMMDITLLDHLVIGRGRYCSLKERGLGFIH